MISASRYKYVGMQAVTVLSNPRSWAQDRTKGTNARRERFCQSALQQVWRLRRRMERYFADFIRPSIEPTVIHQSMVIMQSTQIQMQIRTWRASRNHPIMEALTSPARPRGWGERWRRKLDKSPSVQKSNNLQREIFPHVPWPCSVSSVWIRGF